MMSQYRHVHSTRSRRLARKLSAYAAAGASLYVLCPIGDLQAAIVHIDLGPAGETIPEVVFTDYGSTTAIREIGIDFDQDGASEFTAFHRSFSFDCGDRSNYTRAHDRVGLVRARSPNLIIQFGQPLALGEPIRVDSAGVANADLAFSDWENCGGHGSTNISAGGPFLGRGYAGFVFRGSDDALHTGWADIAASASSLTLFGYAYETIPDKSILAGAVPEPSSLVLLAAGAAGLAMLRRRRRAN